MAKFIDFKQAKAELETLVVSINTDREQREFITNGNAYQLEWTELNDVIESLHEFLCQGPSKYFDEHEVTGKAVASCHARALLLREMGPQSNQFREHFAALRLELRSILLEIEETKKAQARARVGRYPQEKEFAVEFAQRLLEENAQPSSWSSRIGVALSRNFGHKVDRKTINKWIGHLKNSRPAIAQKQKGE